MLSQWIVLILSLLFVGIESFPSKSNIPLYETKCGYESCHPVKEGFINVHIVPHTHDDVGWLKTVDQYYYGSNSDTQKAGVQYIIETVIDSLRRNEDRKFIYVETAFFWKWWIKQSDTTKEEVKQYVNSGRLEFIGGGWSMNDEAATHYHSIIDQMAWGLKRLNDTFGECGRPKIGWQIDPFGHSKEMANIFAQLGFDGFLIGRIDHQDKDYRWKTHTPEFVWRSSKSLGEPSDIFSGILYNRYSPPPGFCFDLLCSDLPFIDDEESFEYNVDDRVDEFLRYVDGANQVYTTNNILITMGDDFNYQDAEAWFINLDKLIYYVNKRQESGSKYNLLYSTPSCYVKAISDATKDTNWLLKQDDFFPYASDDHSYWTGYFVSRPTVKRFERYGNNFLQVCKQLYTLADLGQENIKGLNDLREVMGVLQHHDAVAGTEKQHVADDYSRQLQRAIDECEGIISTALNKLLTSSLTKKKGNLAEPLQLNTCPLANVSQCAATENSDNFVVTIYNPLSRPVDKLVRLPITEKSYAVVDKDGNALPAQIVPIDDYVQRIPGRQSSATHELYFVAEAVPPLGWKSFIVSVSETSNTETSSAKTLDSIRVDDGNYYTLSQDSNASFAVSATTGLIIEITLNGISLPVTQTFNYYHGFVGDNGQSESRSSGAYVFRPDGDINKIEKTHSITLFEGSIVSEIRQVFNEYITQVVRINKIENYVEFDWLVGPIPSNETNGIEVVTTYSSNIETGGIVYTDSNGKEMLKRVRDFRPTWEFKNSESASGNYYPITSKIAIRDDDVELAVLNDRAQGGGSLNDGEIEVMIHRNCLHDDAFGVGEALNEKAFDQGLVVRGSHYVTIGNLNSEDGSSIAAIEKDIAQRRLLDSWTFITPLEGAADDYKSQYIMEFNGLASALPDNVQLLTLEPWSDSTFLLRLEHVFDYDEDTVLSQPALVKLKDLFTSFDVVSLEETTLGGNQWLKDSHRLKFNTNGTLEDLLYEDYNTNAKYATLIKNSRIQETNAKKEIHLKDNLDELEITLNPSDIRTFIIRINRK